VPAAGVRLEVDRVEPVAGGTVLEERDPGVDGGAGRVVVAGQFLVRPIASAKAITCRADSATVCAGRPVDELTPA
jgi:hypothetical protein